MSRATASAVVAVSMTTRSPIRVTFGIPALMEERGVDTAALDDGAAPSRGSPCRQASGSGPSQIGAVAAEPPQIREGRAATGSNLA